MVEVPIDTLPSLINPLSIAILILIFAFIAGQILKRIIKSIAKSTGVDKITQGTSFDRIAHSFGSNTVGVFSTAIAWIVYISGIVAALEVLNIGFEGSLVRVAEYIPNLIAAALIIIIGAIIADRASILISERLEKIRISGISFISTATKYSIFFIVLLMALSQLGVSTTSLYILLAAYLIGIIIITTVAFKTALSSFVGGLYILTTQPYSVGDKIRIDSKEGIVQEIDILTTRIENEEREYIVPNDQIFTKGISKKLKT